MHAQTLPTSYSYLQPCGEIKPSRSVHVGAMDGVVAVVYQ